MPSFSAPQVLTAQHRVEDFRCGKAPLDEFLRFHALDKQNAMLSRTYVVQGSDQVIVAYYTLAHITVSPADAPKKIARGMPGTIPAILLGRLAVDERFQGHGLGSSLFRDAILRTWAVMKDGSAPVRFFVVDAIDLEAQAFYLRLRMQSAPSNPLRLFLHYKDLRAIFESQA